MLKAQYILLFLVLC